MPADESIHRKRGDKMNVYKCIIYLGTAKIIKFVESYTPQRAIYQAADLAGLKLLSDAIFEVYQVA